MMEFFAPDWTANLSATSWQKWAIAATVALFAVGVAIAARRALAALDEGPRTTAR